MTFGWTCKRCTYVHRAPGQRCVMCGEMRVSRQQMRDFVRGIPVNDQNDTAAPKPAPTSCNNTVANTLKPDTETYQSMLPSSRKSRPTINNPYAKSSASMSQRTCSSAASSNFPDPAQEEAASVPVFTSAARGQLESNPIPASLQSLQKPVLDRALDPAHATPFQMECESTSVARQGPVKATDEGSINAFARMTAAASNHARQSARQKQVPSTENRLVGGFAKVDVASTNNARTATSKQPSKKQTKVALPTGSMARPVFNPGPVPFDEQAAQHWIYPKHDEFPIRQYQLEMTETALFHNTLVSLPTGLGKTLIAAVVLYNFQRWFPTGLVLFLAPTLPLVNQQVQACGEIMNIPSAITAVLTGRLSPNQREKTWSTKRVFFCTPQTVQKDLQQGNCPAQQVVAVVMDEAHKSTGDYAYVKVIELLEQAGAKFRVLGLSATPGANIKAIQHVVDALRINKIDARSEEDATVSPYIHSRKSEIVLVPQSSTAKDIEHALNDLVSPYLEKIRNAAGGIAKRLVGNASVTSYQVIMTRDDLYQRDPELFQRMQGYFHVAQTFVQLRDYLHKHGVGMVRMRLQTLQNERQRGLMSSLLKEPAFQRLSEAVAKACTSAPGATQSTTVQDKLANNPKLAKLTEILSEHFERAKACSKASTRAIVFSQFRDSVSEIVQVLHALKPLIRPRHFIGQGKGPKQTDSADGSALQQLKGMRQSEQHQVIREFRADVHNVLVCTCIGEEGLDIGEVDLIVNFDTLRNPIRMIQRVGRTGRKREGRVVCLVSEGAEEKTLSASRQSERNLIHALKNPKSFKCLPTVPMFPFQPGRKDLQMRLSQKFHISQVEGHNSMSKKADKPSKTTPSAQWRLSEEEDAQRTRLFGDLANVHVKFKHELPPALRRVFLSARGLKCSNAESHGSGRCGRTLRLLRRFECAHQATVPVTKQQNHTRIARSAVPRGGDQAIGLLFPLARSVDTSCESIASLLSNSLEGSLVAASATASTRHHTTEISVSTGEQNPYPLDEDKVPLTLIAPQDVASASGLAVADYERRETALAIQTDAPSLSCPLTTVHETNDHPAILRETFSCPANGSSHFEHQKAYEARGEEIDEDVFVLQTPPDDESSSSSEDESQLGNARKRAALHFDSASSTNVSLHDVPGPVNHRRDDTAGSSAESDSKAVNIEDEFRLPSDDSSSSSDGESEPEDTIPLAPSREAIADVSKQESHIGDGKSSAVDKQHNDPTEEELRKKSDLQDTTSEDDDVPLVSCNRKRPTQGVLKKPETRKVLKKGHPRVIASPSNSIELSVASNHTKTSKSPKTPGVRFSLETLSAHQPGGADSQDEDVPLRRARKPANRLAIQDTQESSTSQDLRQFHPQPAAHEEILIEDTPTSQAYLPRGASTPNNARPGHREEIILVDSPLSDAKALALVDTPQEEEKSMNVDEIVCAVCLSGTSPDDNPIILCDGPADCIPCNLAVHLSCYSVPKDRLADETWRCDPCSFYFSGGVGRVFCYVCGQENGVLKLVDTHVWKHVNCESGDFPRGQGERKRLRKKGEVKTVTAKQQANTKRRRPLENVSPNQPARVATSTSTTNHRGRKHHYRKFLDQEAAIDSDEDMDGDDEEEDEIAAIEDAEALTDFINDSSQLGYSEDDLDRVDPPDANDDTLHRDLDLERERETEFATPILNRRHLRRKRDGKWTDTPESAPSSEKGLGNMHFIRSVLEHHREGGRDEEIEDLYHRLEDEVEVPDEAQLRPQRPQPTRTVVHYQDVDSDEDDE